MQVHSYTGMNLQDVQTLAERHGAPGSGDSDETCDAYGVV